MRAALVVFVGVMVAAGLCGTVVAGSFDAPGIPSAGSGMYTLQNLYDYLTSGAALTVQSSFQEPSAAPGSTMKTTREIGDGVQALFTQCPATAADVKSGVTFFSTETNNWGPRLGVNVPSSSFGWGENSSGDPSNVSFWPTTLYAYGRSGGAGATGTMAIYPVSASSPLYSGTITYQNSYALQSILFDGTAFKFLSNTQRIGYFFPSTSVTQSLTSARGLTVVEYEMGGETASLQSVIYGTLRKLVAGTDYTEELRSSDNIQKGWTPFNYIPVPNDFGNMDVIAGPYPNLYDENIATFYSKTSSPNSESHIMHKIILGEFSEDAIRLFMRYGVNRISGRATNALIYIWNFTTSSWVCIGSQVPGSSITLGVRVCDMGINNYRENNVIYLLSRAQGSNDSGNVVTTSYYDFGMWVGYKNPQDLN